MEILIVVVALAVIVGAFYFGTKRKAKSARQQFGPVDYDVHKEHGGIVDRLAKAARLRKEDDKPARRWPVEAGDVIQSFEGLPHHESWLFGQVTERISPTRVMVLFDGELKPVRRRISRLFQVRKAIPFTEAA